MANIILSFPQSGTGAFGLPHKSMKWNTVEQMPAGFRGATYISLAPYPLWHWEFTVPYLRGRIDQPGTAVAILNGVIGSMRGRGDTFLYFDPDDNVVNKAQFGTGDASTIAFQISKPLGLNADIIQDFVGSPQIYVNGTVQTAGTNYSIDTFGVITFTSAPAANAVLTWSGQFNRSCRFDNDDIAFQKIAPDTWACDNLDFTTVIR
jgi:hypothetical protein